MVEFAGEILVPDVEALTDEVGAILVAVEHEHELAVGLDEPAEPAREHRSELDRQRARHMTF